MEEMKNLLEERFHFISEVNKEFLLSFDEEMEKLGYGIYEVKDAYPWAMNWIGAKYMTNYKVKRLKTRKLVAHVFVKEDGIFLRLFALKNNVRTINTREKARSVIAPHRAYIESAPLTSRSYLQWKSLPVTIAMMITATGIVIDWTRIQSTATFMKDA